MPIRIAIFLALIFSATLILAQKKQVCFSFDDLPAVTYGVTDSSFQKNLMNKLVSSLKTYHIPAIGFVNESKLYNEDGIIPFKVGLLNSWINSGLELGNHTYSHPDYNKVSFEYFSQDILRNETITTEILKRKDKSTMYFRHPILHVGNSKSKADSLDNFLAIMGTLLPLLQLTMMIFYLP